MKIGKLSGVGSSVEYVRAEIDAFGIALLPIRYEHILQLERMPLHHSDPFDRLLIAQAASESLTVLTQDARFKDYPIKLVW